MKTMKIVPYMEFYRTDDGSNDVYVCIQSGYQHENYILSGEICEREIYSPHIEYDMTLVKKEIYDIVKNDPWLIKAMKPENQKDFHKKGYYNLAFYNKLWGNRKYFKATPENYKDIIRALNDEPVIENGYISSWELNHYKFKYKDTLAEQ